MFKETNGYLKRYFRLTNLNRPLFALNIISAVLYKGFSILLPIAAALIIKALTEQNAKQTYFCIIAYFIIYTAFVLSKFFNFKAYAWSVNYTYRVLQTKIFERLINVDGNFARKINRGKLMNTINTDTINIGAMYDEISEYLTTGIQIVVIFAITSFYSWPIAILMSVSAISYAAIRNHHDRKYNFYWYKTQASNDYYSHFLNQIVSGHQEVKTFNLLPKMEDKLFRNQTKFNKAYKKQRRHAVVRDNDVKIVYYTFHAVFYAILIFMIMKGLTTIDILILLIAYHEYTFTFVKDLTDATIEIRLTSAALSRVNALLHYRPDKEIEFGDLDLDDLQGTIQLKNVYLTIDRQSILKNVNLKFHRHEFVAIVGLPGAGKTKLIDLILRISKPTKGHILLDGININEFSREVFTSNVAVANQSPFIFNTSIRKNLDFVDTDISKQIEACKIAGIHDFIQTLPQGYNTILRENATNFSGGQRQMLSIARTILTDAEILLFDDVTTSLDPDTAKLVPKLIKKLKTDRTVIMITKKPEIMKLADRIIVLDKGKVSDSGTHEKLLERSAIYRSLQVSRSQTTTGVRS